MKTDTSINRLNAMFWIGIAGFGLATVVGLLGFHKGSLWRMPIVLKAEVQTALTDAGYPGLQVEMQGQKAVLRGEVADPQAMAGAQRAALTAAGIGGPWAGGVTEVDITGLRARSAAR